jgi:hypothetical protein
MDEVLVDPGELFAKHFVQNFDDLRASLHSIPSLPELSSKHVIRKEPASKFLSQIFRAEKLRRNFSEINLYEKQIFNSDNLSSTNVKIPPINHGAFSALLRQQPKERNQSNT